MSFNENTIFLQKQNVIEHSNIVYSSIFLQIVTYVFYRHEQSNIASQ